jgi:AcrR family transcriptional regulator
MLSKSLGWPGSGRDAPGGQGRGAHMSRSFRPGRAATPPPRPLAGVPEFAPRKLPRQARSQATFTAIVDACSRVLANSSYEALTTNRISERAGVSIGTLYEYFPNREAIVAALVDAACRRLVARMERAVEEASRLPRFEGVEHLLTSGVETLAAPENGLTLLLRDAPFVSQLPAFREMRGPDRPLPVHPRAVRGPPRPGQSRRRHLAHLPDAVQRHAGDRLP